MTTEQFIEKAKTIHGNKYDYSLVDYKNNKTKIKIICPTHGLFEQTPEHHIKTKGCSKCSRGVPTTEQFIEKAQQIHGNKYDYSLVSYKTNLTKIKIICSTHGIFEQRPLDHLSGCGCSKCANNSIPTIGQFIEKAKLVHGDKYDYSEVEYKNKRTKIKIICPTHGVFNQTPNNHLLGYGCRKCANNLNYTTEQFIEKAKQIHGDKYDYSLVNYKSNRTKVKIICPAHGEFSQIASSHMSGNGCPICKSSKGEVRILNFLIQNKIQFEQYKKFKDLKDKNLLSYDFYIPSKNLLIEYNGEQHYKKGKFKNHNLLLQKHHDWLKRKYAKDNRFNFLVIPFTKFNEIEDELQQQLL